VNNDEKITYYQRIFEDKSLNPDEKQRILNDNLETDGKFYREAMIKLGLKPTLQVDQIRKNRREKPNFIVLIKTEKDQDGKEYSFVKVFREFSDLLVSKKLSKNARCFVGTFLANIDYPTNKIMINGEPPTFEDLKKITGMSENTLRETINKLEYFEVIKKVLRNGYFIYFNPFLVCGKGVTASTFTLFKDSIYNIYRLEE
jgi:hypothetical protein